MVRDMSEEGLAKFRKELDSQYEMFKKGLITRPKKALIDKGFERYIELDPERQEKFDELKRAHIKAEEDTGRVRRMRSTTTK